MNQGNFKQEEKKNKELKPIFKEEEEKKYTNRDRD